VTSVSVSVINLFSACKLPHKNREWLAGPNWKNAEIALVHMALNESHHESWSVYRFLTSV